ncbi:DNA binding protein [Fragilaria crotonensis]|nr:DNA binding protein [Fragilaria crotonensis]
MEKAQGTGESMQTVTRVSELIQIADNGNLQSSNQSVRPHGSLSLMGIPPLHPFMTQHSTHAFPAASAIQSLRPNTLSVNAIQQAVHALRRADLVHNLNWSPPSNLASSAGLYADIAVRNGHSLSPLNSIDVMSQVLISQTRRSPRFHLPHEHTLLSASEAPPTASALRQPALPTSISRGLTTGGIEKRSFPIILHRALHELDRLPGGSDVAAFLPDGRSFCIRDHQEFADLVLPVFFPKMKGYASFQRQLNLYDFKRVGGMGPDRGCYQHSLFHRDYPDYLTVMKRRKIKGPSSV